MNFRKWLAAALLVAAFATPASGTISSTTTQTITANGNNATVNFTIGFSFLDNDYINVYSEDTSVTPHTRSLLTYGAGAGQYTITGGDPGTTVHMGTAPDTNHRLVIKRVTPHTQTVNYDENSAFPADDHEEQMDKMVEAVQEQQSQIDAKIGLADGSTSSVPTFPEPQASSYLRYNGSSALEARTAAQTITDLGVLKASNNLSDLTSVSAALANLGVLPGTALPTLGAASTVLNSTGAALQYSLLTNSNLDPAAGIVDTKLATISTAGKVSNSATTAASANTPSAIVARDGSGNFTAGTITAALTGNSSTATALAANPTDCGAGTKATAIDASGNLTCSAVSLTADVSGNLPVTNLNSGTSASATTYWRGDGTWGTPVGSGTITGPGASVDNEMVLWNSTTGTVIKRAAGTGVVSTASGVVTQGICTAANGCTGISTSASTGVPTIAAGTWTVPSKLVETLGGTNQSTYTTGDLLYASGTNTLSKLGLGGDGRIIQQRGGLPSYQRQAGVGFNYLVGSDSDFETTVGNWSAYADAAGTQPVDATGGAPTTTCTRATSSPLRDTANLLITKDAANRQGEGCKVDYTIDSADLAKPLLVSFDYTVGSGTYADGDLTVWDYDGTNVTQLAPYKILSVTAGVSQKWIGYYQTASTGTSHRLAFHVASTSASAYTVKVDNITVSPTYQSYGAVATDWTAFTPTGTWVANTTYTGFWRRCGDTLSVRYKLALAGAPTSATLTVNLPTGMTIDTTKLTGTPGSIAFPGYLFGTGAANGFTGGVTYSSTTALQPFYTKDGSTASIMTEGSITQAAPYTFANGDGLWFEATSIPISGWSSNVQVSSDADTRVVSAQANFKTPTGTISSSYNIVKFGSVDKDTHAGYNTSTGLYTIPVSGYYFASTQIEIAGTYAAGQYAQVALSRNGTPGTSDTLYGSVRTYGAGASFAPAVSGVIYFNAGDTLGIYSLTGASGGPSFSTAMNGSNFSINRLSGPAQIAASESVNARYYASATSINGSLATVSWTTKDYDSHSGMSSGTYTIPVAGKYQVNTALALSGTFALNNQSNFVIQKNGTTVSELLDYAAGAETADHVFLSDIISCNQGDTIRVQVSSGATGPAIVSSNTKNYFSISKVGN